MNQFAYWSLAKNWGRIALFLAAYAGVTPAVLCNDNSGSKDTLTIGAFKIPEEPSLELKDMASDGKSKEDTIYHIRSESGNFTDSGVVTWIASETSNSDSRPHMPQLQARLEGINRNLVVQWRFEVAYH